MKLYLCVKVLVLGEAAGMASVRRDQVLPPCQTEPVPDVSNMDPPLPKALKDTEERAKMMCSNCERGLRK